MNEESIPAYTASDTVGLVERCYHTFGSEDAPFVLENRQSLSEVTTCYEVYGQLNAEADNAILVLHGLTGSSHAAGWYGPESKFPGYWEPLIGPGKVFDTRKYCVIAPNALGGCRGSTGPASVDPRTGKEYGLTFPIFTIRDMVRVQEQLLNHLGVRRLKLVVGGSMGGMQALEWCITFPDWMEAACVIASSARNSAQAIAFNECMRRAIMLDPHWNKGEYYGVTPPGEGLALARMIGTITYLSDPIMQQLFGRKPENETTALEYDLYARFDVERYLHDEGEKLVRRFDANSYLYLTRAIDLHDISRGYESREAAYRRIQAKLLLIAIRSDILFHPQHVREMDAQLRALGKDSTFWELDSEYGHDAFLTEQEKMIPSLQELLARTNRTL
jgi:homoserine O-acetyltransferase